MARLQNRSGDRVAHELTAEPATLGRDDDCDIVVDDPQVSRRHARVEVEGSQWRVVDLKSRNGTFVNNHRVTSASLRSGDDVRIGQTTLTFHTSEDPRATIPAGQGGAEGLELTSREREVLALVADGNTDRQIAVALVININTVQSHLDRIRDKTGCRRRAELTRWALANNIS